MDDMEFIEDRRSALAESVKYFSQKNKPERERWVCGSFLRNIDRAFDETEILSQDDEPPDVAFRDVLFEVKEVLDPGRLRHTEYKAAFI